MDINKSALILYYICLVLMCCMTLIRTETTGSNNTSPEITSTTNTITTTPVPIVCSSYNNSCGDCVYYTKCYYCLKDNICRPYNYTVLKPMPQECGELKDMAWGMCLVSFKTLTITLAVVGSAVLIAITVCCCCCCRKCSDYRRKQFARQLDKWERIRSERKEAAEERKQEREERRDEIRRKYNLPIKTDNPYQRF